MQPQQHEGNSQVIECFLSGRHTDRRTCEAVFRSTIHQLVRDKPAELVDTIKRVLPRVLEGSSGHVDWTLDRLIILWPEVIAAAVGNGRQITMVLDSFDELEDHDQNAFLKCLSKYENLADTRDLRGSFRIVVLSQWCSSLDQHERGFIKYEVKPEDTSSDIAATVKEALSAFSAHANYSREIQKVMRTAITRGAQGVYLWATVMVEDIKVRMPREDQLSEQLRQLPKGLVELYDEILGRINSLPGDRGNKTRRVLQWLALCQEPLKLQELNTGLALAELWEQDPKKRIDKDLLRRRRISDDLFKASLYLICGQLLRISSSGHVELVHRTLSQYLTTSSETYRRVYKTWRVPNRHFYLQEPYSHAALGNMCAAYLMMPSFESAGEPFIPDKEVYARWDTKVQDRIDTHDFIRYAALCWLRHAELAGSIEEANNENRRILQNMASQYAISWFEVWWFIRKWPGEEFPRGGVDPGAVGQELCRLYSELLSAQGQADGALEDKKSSTEKVVSNGAGDLELVSVNNSSGATNLQLLAGTTVQANPPAQELTNHVPTFYHQPSHNPTPEYPSTAYRISSPHDVQLPSNNKQVSLSTHAISTNQAPNIT